MDSFAQRIKSKRKDLGLAQWQMADRIGISLQTYKDWEAGRHEPQAGIRKVVEEMFPDA